MPCNYSVYDQQRMKLVYFVEWANTNKDKAGNTEGKVEGNRIGYNKRENVCFQSVEVGVRLEH